MPMPRREVKMARCAGAALLAAVEIYNKPTVEYREQTFSILVTNAWEVLLKARLIQKAGGRIETIYRREAGSQRYQRASGTGEPLTINLRMAISRADVPEQVRNNISGMAEIRNRSAHLGVLAPAARKMVMQFGSASVVNFTKMSMKWFDEAPVWTYLLPVGFVQQSDVDVIPRIKGQRLLIETLRNIASGGHSANEEFAVTLNVDIRLNPVYSGGASIGPTDNPAAPRVRLSDDQILELYSSEYSDIVAACRARYSSFKKNIRFHSVMEEVKSNSECSYKRMLDPKSDASAFKMLYNLDKTMAKLDEEYD